jgi:hypothetical protein
MTISPVLSGCRSESNVRDYSGRYIDRHDPGLLIQIRKRDGDSTI